MRTQKGQNGPSHKMLGHFVPYISFVAPTVLPTDFYRWTADRSVPKKRPCVSKTIQVRGWSAKELMT
jgi:hypothetical protein